jgi:hypothetical protein
MTTSSPPDVDMTDSTPSQPQQSLPQEPKYGGFTRFEVELEVCPPSHSFHKSHEQLQLTSSSQFVQCLYDRPFPLISTTSSTSTTSSKLPLISPHSHTDIHSANPHYLLHLATLTTASTDPSTTTASVPLLGHPPFIAYLSYLQYFASPPYLKYLTYPGPTLKNLELLQNERFRREVLSPDVVARLFAEGQGAVAAV